MTKTKLYKKLKKRPAQELAWALACTVAALYPPKRGAADLDPDAEWNSDTLDRVREELDHFTPKELGGSGIGLPEDNHG